jgi:DNA-binding transcriptional LysR family regulator
MGLTPSAVSKVIGRLEARLGVRLVNRTTRKLSLTAEGETYFASGRRLIDAVDGLEHEVSASAGEPRGLLRISTAVSFGVPHLAPAMIEFQRRYPQVLINLSLTDRAIDLHAEQIDVALRVGPLRDSSLMSRKISEVGRVLCAAPKYLEKFGVPKRPEDLAGHSCIVFTVAGRGRWPFKTAAGGIEHMDVSGRFATDSNDCMLQLALHGAGIARLADFQAARPVKSRALVPLLVDYHHPEPTPAYAIFPPGTQKIPKVRVFLDFLLERFGRDSGRPGRR